MTKLVRAILFHVNFYCSVFCLFDIIFPNSLLKQIYFYIVIYCISLTERNVEVILDVHRENSLIFAVHSGLGTSLTSRAQASHLGRDKCYSTLQECYSFPMIRQHIHMYIKYCEPCQMQNTYKLEKCSHVLKSILVPAKCWSKISLDLIGPLKESNGKKYIISCIDNLSKYVEAKAIEN